MSNLKKMLSVFMAVAMLMSVMVMGTGAAFTDQKDVKNTEAVDMNVALGIIKGYEDGSFKPTANVTRAEMAKMICFMLNGGKDPTLGTVATSTFTDTKGHWAAPYIEYCVASGIVAGIGGGLYAPDATVTATQAAKMLLVCMGYEAATEGYNGATWAVKINVRANAKGLYDSISVDPNAPLNRDNASQMVWNALNAGMNEYSIALGTDANGALQNIKTAKDKTRTVISNGVSRTVAVDMLWNNFKAITDVNRMTGYKWNATDKEFGYDFQRVTNATLEKDHYTSKTDYTGLFMENVKVVYKVDNNNKQVVYGMFADDSAVMAVGSVSDLGYVDDSTVKIDGTKYKLDTKITSANDSSTSYKKDLKAYEENKGQTYRDSSTPNADVKTLNDASDPYSMKAIDVDGNGKIDYFTYLPFKYAKVNSVGKTTASLTQGSATTSLKFDTDTIYEGIAKDDAIMVVDTNNSAYEGSTAIKMESFEGSVTGTKPVKDNAKKDNQIQIDGTWYTNGNVNTPVEPSVGNKSTFYKVGSYVYYTDELTSATIDNVLYVAVTTWDSLSAKAKVYFADGTSDTVTVKEIRTDEGKKHTDPLSTLCATGTASPASNKMYTYSKKGSDYTLTAVGAKNKVGCKDYATVSTNAKITAASSNKSGKLALTATNTFAFADDAIVFIELNDNTVKVVNGKVARDYKSDVTGTSAYVLSKEINGTNTARVACITSTVTEVPNSKGEADNYAYVLSDSYETQIDGTKYNAVSIWNGTKTVDVIYDESVTLLKGNIITYNNLNDKEIDDPEKLCESNTLTTTSANGQGGKYAVKGMADAGKTLTLAQPDVSGTKVGDYVITKDTKTLYVNTDGKVGEESGSISLAAQDGNYKANVAVYFDNADNEITLIVVDNNNDWKN